MNRVASAFALCLATASASWAVEPKASISGDTEILVGQTAWFDATKSKVDEGQKLRWKTAKPLPAGSRLMTFTDEETGMAGGLAAYRATGPGTFTFVLVAAGTVEGKLDFDVDTIVVTVGDGSPKPDDTPPIVVPPVVPPKPAPPVYPPGSDQAIGLDWMTQLNVGAATALDSAALGNWTTTEELTSQMVAQFDAVFATAWVTAADSLDGVAGPVSKTPVQPAVKAALQAKLKNLATGARGAAR